MGGEEQYEVKAICSHQCHGCSRQLQYLLKWKGYPESDNTWESAEQLHFSDLVKQYHKKHPLNCIKAALIQQQQNNSAPWQFLRVNIASLTLTLNPYSAPISTPLTNSTSPNLDNASTSLTSMPSGSVADG